MRVLIVDDHPVVRKGLLQILADEPDVTVAVEAESATRMLELVGEEHWDIVILDITLPDRSGLEALKDLKAMKPALPVLILSMHPEDQYAMRVLKAGASGYMNKDSASEELVNAMRKVLGGGKYVSPSMAEKLATAIGSDYERPAHENLSDREFQVMCLIASGRRLKEVAEELCLSVKTVSTYRARVLEKMGMENNAEMTYYAIKNGLID
ncbi:MAG: response regulator transcription factor [Actinomycetota bacterium]